MITYFPSVLSLSKHSELFFNSLFIYDTTDVSISSTAVFCDKSPASILFVARPAMREP
jgi:hypothetical protein